MSEQTVDSLSLNAKEIDAGEKVKTHSTDTPGGLVRTLGKQLFYSRLYNVFLTVLFAVVVIALVLKPTPVITIDQSGKPVGQYEWYNQGDRSPLEVMASSKRFVQHYTSLNASTIFDDAAIALNAMCDSLKNATQGEWQKTAYLARVYNAGSVSRIEFDDQQTKLVKYEDGSGHLLIVGHLITGIRQPVKKSFNTELKFSVVPRSKDNTLGIEVCGIS